MKMKNLFVGLLLFLNFGSEAYKIAILVADVASSQVSLIGVRVKNNLSWGFENSGMGFSGLSIHISPDVLVFGPQAVPFGFLTARLSFSLKLISISLETLTNL